MILKKVKLFSWLMALALMLSLVPPVQAAGDYVAIDATHFPDAAFRQYVKGYDSNKDNRLSVAERNGVSKMDVSSRNITSLQGIEYFPGLTYLNCYNNKITSLDMSGNPELYNLICNSNNLTSLNVSRNPALAGLFLNFNNLTYLDLSGNPELLNLEVFANDLSSLNLSQNTKLERLMCPENRLTSLDLSRNTALKSLTCSDNQLTSLTLPKNAKLTSSSADQQTYPIITDGSRTFDLSKLPGKFDVRKASSWEGGSVSGNILTVNPGAAEVTYVYTYGDGIADFMRVTLQVTVAESAAGDVVMRVFNPANGKHHYTIGVQEANALVAGGWIYEGFAWIAPETGSPIYRVYNPGNDNHLYTMDAAERDRLVEGGWKYEGILCYSAGTDGVPLYRVLNPYVTLNPHHYTDSEDECEFLKSNGWIVEGVAWYGLK